MSNTLLDIYGQNSVRGDCNQAFSTFQQLNFVLFSESNDVPAAIIESLKNRLKYSFNISEWRELQYELEIEPEDIVGTTKNELISNTVDYLNRRNEISSLRDPLIQKRPNIDWKPFF